MSLGEFDFATFVDNFSQDTIRMGFSMVLLAGLIFLVCLTIYNLFIAVVISDVKDLQEEVFLQNIYNMGLHSYLVEEILPFAYLVKKIKIETKVRICLHDVCRRNGCGGEKLPEEMKHVKDYLRRKYVKNVNDNS